MKKSTLKFKRKCDHVLGVFVKFNIVLCLSLIAGSSVAQAPFSCILIDPEGAERPWGKCFGDLNNEWLTDLVIGGYTSGGLVYYENPGWQKNVISDEPASLRFALQGSSTNPVIGPTRIRFQVPSTSPVTLRLYDVTGRNVLTLADETFTAGSHQIDWDGSGESGHRVASGVYYVRMQAPGFDVTRTIVVSQ